jgi:hypothetical protein
MSIGSSAGLDSNVIDHMLASGEMLPAQLPTASTWTPEKRLAAAVFTSALISIRDYSGDPTRAETVAEDVAWVTADDVVEPFAFLRLCEVFALDPAWVRKCVARWRRSPRDARRPFSMHRHAA